MDQPPPAPVAPLPGQIPARPRDPPPEPPAQPPQQAPPPRNGILYIRGCKSCPTSTALLVYLNALKLAFVGDFTFETFPTDDSEAPRFVIPGGVYYDVDELNDSDTSLSLELRCTEAQNSIRDQVRTKKDDMRDALRSMKYAYLFGYQQLCDPRPQWVIDSVEAIRNELHSDNDEIIEEKLVALMEGACRTLSMELGKNTFFLDSLRKTFDNKTSETSMSSLSILDVQQAASAILIMKYFENDDVLSYTSKIHRILYQHISIWAHTDIIYSWFVKEQLQVIDYTTRLKNNMVLLDTELENSGFQASGGQGTVYKISLLGGNAWELDNGDYAFKISNNSDSTISLVGEAYALQHLPYENICTIVGMGKVSVNNEVGHLNVLKWISGGDLRSRMETLGWTQVKKVAKGIAYALHLVHRTLSYCVVDLKPPNIMLDENDNIILCDFGLCRNSGEDVGGFTGTSLYNDSSAKASNERDVFGYGVILFELLTDQAALGDQFVMNLNGALFGRGIDDYLDQGRDLGTFIKTHLLEQAGSEGDIINQLLTIAARCVNMKQIEQKFIRPSALEILESFRELGI